MSLFSKTHIYTVHIDPEQERAAEKAVFIREGFDFLAFIIAPVWALYHRLWLETFVLIVAVTLLGAADALGWLDETRVAVLNLALNFAIGSWAGDIRRANLSRKGYVHSNVVVSDSELRAKQRYFEKLVTV